MEFFIIAAYSCVYRIILIQNSGHAKSRLMGELETGEVMVNYNGLNVCAVHLIKILSKSKYFWQYILENMYTNEC